MAQIIPLVIVGFAGALIAWAMVGPYIAD